MTYDTVVGRINLLRQSLVHAVVLNAVDAQYLRLLERPGRDIAHELPVTGLLAPAHVQSANTYAFT